MTKLITDYGGTFTLESFEISGGTMNYTFIGHENNPTAYEPYRYSLVYVEGNELEAVKNFLMIIRDNPS